MRVFHPPSSIRLDGRGCTLISSQIKSNSTTEICNHRWRPEPADLSAADRIDRHILELPRFKSRYPEDVKSNALRLLEPLSVFGGILGYIWSLRFRHPWSWVALIGFVVLSHVVRRERPPALGFRVARLGDCLRTFGPALLAVALVLAAAGVELGTVRPIGLERAVSAFALYLPWGLFQQYLMNGYFLKRLDAALSPRAADIATAALFSVVHTPNWFLMLVTPLAGYGAIRIYRRYLNLYFLAVAHAMIGFLLFMTVPDAISHHLNIGPGSLSR